MAKTKSHNVVLTHAQWNHLMDVLSQQVMQCQDHADSDGPVHAQHQYEGRLKAWKVDQAYWIKRESFLRGIQRQMMNDRG